MNWVLCLRWFLFRWLIMLKTIDRIILIILTIGVWGLIATFCLKPTSGFAQNSVKDLPPFKSSLRDKQPVPKKEEIVEKNVGEKIEKPKPTHCTVHKRYMKSCSSCITIVQRGY